MCLCPQPWSKEFVSDYDIICVTETHLDMFDVIDLDNYLIHNKIRKYCKRKSGGISIIYKKTLEKSINIKNTSCDYVLWFTLSNFSNECKTVLFGAVYLVLSNRRLCLCKM